MGWISECFQDEGKVFVLKTRRKSLEITGDSSDAHSRRTRGGIPSEPYALVMSSFDRARRTRRIEKMGKGIKLVGGGFGGGGALESSKVELFWKRVLKAKHFSNGEVATESSGKIRGGIKEFEKLLEILLVRDQSILVLFESERSAHFCLMKTCLTLLIYPWFDSW